MRIDEYLQNLITRFTRAELAFGHGTDNPQDEAVYLLYCSLGLDFDGPAAQLQRELTTAEMALLESRASQRIDARIPVAYLVGEAWFAGYGFHADPRALIPRSPIAELIEQGFASLLHQEPAKILDLCTGGGCIGIACALEFPRAEVHLADLSAAALQLAQANVQRYELENRVRLIQSDLYAEVTDRYDLILCNPPYVAAEIVADLAPEYRHEPDSGLLSADQGLEIPVRVLAGAAEHLHPQGWLIMEVGCAAESLQRRFPQLPFLWLEFERGGDGVLALSAAQLQQYRQAFI
jgi:ribosomal protein L3 glutamine methyltransferase